MRTSLACALLVVTTLLPAAARAQASDPWLGPDKALHFTATFALASGGYQATALRTDEEWPRWLAGGGLAMGAGVAKELYDLSSHGTLSWRDLAWDGVGTAVGLGVTALAWRLLLPVAARALDELRAPDHSQSPTAPGAMAETRKLRSRQVKLPQLGASGSQ